MNYSKNKKLYEWLDSNGNKVSLNDYTKQVQQAQQANYLFKDNFMKLAHHIEDCHDWSLVNYISECELDLDYTDSGVTRTLTIDVNSTNIKVYLEQHGKKFGVFEASYSEWSKVLSYLKNMRVIQNPKLCESISLSTIDEFKLYEKLWESGNEPQYDYRHENGVYKVYKDGEYILSCEHLWEMDKEIAEYEEEQAAKQQTSKNKYRVSWSIIDRKDHRQDFSVDNILASNEAEARALANIPDDPYVRNITVIQV